MPFADIPQQAFTPYEGVFSYGYSAANFWFRLTIDPARARGAPLASTDKVVLRIRPPYLREVEFFDPAHPEERRRLSGDLISTVLCVTFVSEIFDYRLFRTFRVPQTFSCIQLLLMTFPLAGMGLALFGDIRTAMVVNVISALCFSLVTMVSSYFCFPARSGPTDAAELPRWVIAASYTVICGFLLSTLFPQLGLYAGSEFAVYSLAFHTALSTTLVSVIIARRAKHIHDDSVLLAH